MDESQGELYQAVGNIYYRGLHKGPETVTLTQAIFVFPLVQIALMYLPKIVYILILNVRKAGNGMKISEHAVLFVFPIFTNLYYAKGSKQNFHLTQNFPENIEENILEPPPQRRALSAPDLIHQSVETPAAARPRSVPAQAQLATESLLDEPDFCIFHSNILYMFFLTGTSITMAADVLVVQRAGRGLAVSTVTYTALLGVMVNLVLWLDFNYTMYKRRQADDQADNNNW